MTEAERRTLRHEVAMRRIAREDAMAAEALEVDELPEPPDDDGPAALGDPTLLSSREREVLFLVACGYANEEIGAALFITAETVKTHVRHVLLNLGARNRTHAVAIALNFTRSSDAAVLIAA